MTGDIIQEKYALKASIDNQKDAIIKNSLK